LCTSDLPRARARTRAEEMRSRIYVSAVATACLSAEVSPVFELDRSIIILTILARIVRGRSV